MKILILCTGNSCRSQMAQALLSSFHHSLEVFSAGTAPAEQVNPNAVIVMNELEIDMSKAYPKSVNQYLDEEWDYVITVCGGANENCPTFSGNVNYRLHFGFDDPAAVKGDTDYVIAEFRRIRDEIKDRFYTFYLKEINLRGLTNVSDNNE